MFPDSPSELPEPAPLEIEAGELQRLIQSGNPLQLIDCREPHEFELAHLAGAQLLPTSRIRQWLPELANQPELPLVVYCHHGIRSFHVVCALRQSGFRHAQSLSGGIDQWSQVIDPTIPRY